MASENRRPRYKSTDVSSSNFDEDPVETETESEEIESDARVRHLRVSAGGSETLTRRGGGMSHSRRTAGNLEDGVNEEDDDDEDDEEDDEDAEEMKRDKIKHQAGQLAVRAKETGLVVGAKIRRRSLSAGKSIRKRSRSAGRAVKTASISAGKEIRTRSISAGKGIRKRSASVGKSISERSSSAAKSIRERSISAGKSFRNRSLSAGKGIKAGSVIAGKAVKDKSIATAQKMKSGSKIAGKKIKENSKVAGKKIKENSKVAGKKIKENSIVAGKNLKEKSKSAGKALRERSISAAERMKRRKSSSAERKNEGGEEEEEEEEEGMNPSQSSKKKSPKERWGDSLRRGRTKTKVKFENAKLKLTRMPRPQCVRPALEGEEEDEETGSRRTQVEVFEIPSRGSKRAATAMAAATKGGSGFQSPQRIIYRENGNRNYFSVFRNGREVVTPAEEEEDDDDEEEYLSPMPEEEEKDVEEEDLEDADGNVAVEDQEEEADREGMEEGREEDEEADEDEKELSVPDPVVANEETSRDEILGSDFLSTHSCVERHRLHLRRISTAMGKNLRRGPRIGGRIDALRETFKGRKLGEASDRRLAKRFAKFAKFSGNPAAEAILKDTGRCFERSAEVVDDLEDAILSHFLHPLKTFIESDSKMLKPKEKKLEKLADKIVLARSEGVMTQANFEELSFHFANHRDELLESYSCILDREDEQSKRLAEIAGAYTAFNRDNFVVFNATLETLKQSLDQLEKNAAAESAVASSSSSPGEEFGISASKTEDLKAASSSFGGGNGVIGAHWALAGQGDDGRIYGSMIGMIEA